MDYQILCRTKEKRERLAGEIEQLALAHGGVQLERRPLWHPRSLHLVLGFGPRRLTVDFDGDLKINTWLGHWWTDCDAPQSVRYPDGFGVNTDVNLAHHRKATTGAGNWTTFMHALRGCFEDLAALSAEATP